MQICNYPKCAPYFLLKIDYHLVVYGLLANVKSALIYAWNLRHFEVCHFDPTLPANSDQKLLNRAFRPLNFHLHSAVPHILYPTGETERLRDMVGAETKTDALDIS